MPPGTYSQNTRTFYELPGNCELCVAYVTKQSAHKGTNANSNKKSYNQVFFS